MKVKKVLITHYRIGGNDGVSLEIEKRKTIFKKLGFKYILVAGPVSKNVDYIIDELEFDIPEINKIKKNCFEKLNDFSDCNKLIEKIYHISNVINKKIELIYEKEKFSYIVLHNIFSHGRHIAAAKAFFEFIVKYKVPAISFNHDFYWDRKIYQNPTCKKIQDYLDYYVPPGNSLIKHVVINSFNKTILKQKKDIDSVVIPDLFYFPEIKSNLNDKFSRKYLFNKIFFNKIYKKSRSIENSELNCINDLLLEKNNTNNKNFNISAKTFIDLKGDLIFLHATRIVSRKTIELAIDFVDYFNNSKYFRKLKDKKSILYNGKKLSTESKAILLISGYAEFDSLEYQKKLIEYSKTKKSLILFIGDLVENNPVIDIHFRRNIENDYKKDDPEKNYYTDNLTLNKYNQEKTSLWQLYSIADIITYTSINEGFGNQFLEAIWAYKPVVLFEYPVFKTDIKTKGFRYISLGEIIYRSNSVKNFSTFFKIPEESLDKAAKDLYKFLLSKNVKKILKKNFNLADNYYSVNAQLKIYRNLLNGKGK